MDWPESLRWLAARIFMTIPAGLYLASGVGSGPGQPAFAEPVAPQAEREELWQRIVEARVNDRNCDVFKNPAAYFEFALEIRSRHQRN